MRYPTSPPSKNCSAVMRQLSQHPTAMGSSDSGDDSSVASAKRKKKRLRKEQKKLKKEKKKKEKKKEEKKKRKRDDKTAATTTTAEKKSRSSTTGSSSSSSDNKQDENQQHQPKSARIVESSATEFRPKQSNAKATGSDEDNNITILLFYQYVDPPWSNEMYKSALTKVESLGRQANVTGRMRVAKEGLNCTLTGSKADILSFCQLLQTWQPETFRETEFKLTHDLPQRDAFGNLKIIPVTELVNYGLSTSTSNKSGAMIAQPPSLQDYHGTHLEPVDYHKKLAERDTVVIDVRNHYEAAIGRFQPPTAAKPAETNGDDGDSSGGGAQWVDPLMRKSTEFPVWLDDPKTQEQLRNKQVLMYCTGGIRCERASALLQYKIQTDPTVQDLNIKGVYQLQGGIDKYFKEFPDGGYWEGKNYVFDKRNAHPPPKVEGEEPPKPMGKCEACHKPWDKYPGKRRCPSCGVPSLICRDCHQADKDGTRKLDKRKVRCELCVKQGIFSKRDLKAKEEARIRAYEARLEAKGLLKPGEQEHNKKNGNHNKNTAHATSNSPADNNIDNSNTTRLFIKNMCRTNMTEQVLTEFLPEVTHIVWREDRKTGQFFGQGWVEMANPEAAASAVAKSGTKVLGRPIHISYQPADGKDLWPPPRSRVGK